MEKSDYSALTNTLISKEDASDLILRLDEAIAGLFKSKGSLDEHLAQVFSHAEKDAITAILTAQKIELTDITAIEKVLEHIKKEIQKIPVLELTLSIQPTEKFVRHIQNWVENNATGKVLVETKVDRSIIAGVVMSINGYYHDYSLGKMIQPKK